MQTVYEGCGGHTSRITLRSARPPPGEILPLRGHVVIELLRFAMRPEERAEFVSRNERVWTSALRDSPGYVRHQVLLDRDEPEEVVILVHWRSAADLQSFPRELEQELSRKMGDLGHLRERRVYDVAAGELFPE